MWIEPILLGFYAVIAIYAARRLRHIRGVAETSKVRAALCCLAPLYSLLVVLAGKFDERRWGEIALISL